MDHIKKMVLISPENLNRLRSSDKEDVISSQLDKDMRNILNNSNLCDYEKWTLYREILQRYLHFQKKLKEPIKLPIENEISSESELLTEEQQQQQQQQNDIENIINVIPKAYRNRARLLAERLKSSYDIITWDKKGVVTINNSQIPNSNISDLIGDIVRYRKHNEPVGWEIFARTLKTINVPRELIYNPQRKKFIDSTETRSPQKEKLIAIRNKRKSLYSRNDNNDAFSYETNTESSKRKKTGWKRFSFN